MGRNVNRIPFFLAALALAACALHPGRGVKSCHYRFQNLAFTGMDASQTNWQVNVTVSNPNAHDVTLTRMKFALLHDADTLIRGWNPEKRVVASMDSQMILTSLSLPNSVWQRLPPEIWTQTEAKFVIVADAYLNTWMGDLVVPGAVRQTIKINMPEQAGKLKDMLMRRFFSWPGQRLLEDPGTPGIPAPAPPGPSPAQPPAAPDQDPWRDEPL